MTSVLLQMALLIGCGLAWRQLAPGGLDHGQVRRSLTSLVYYLFLPALVLDVLWRANLGQTTLYIALAAAWGILFGSAAMWLSCRLCRTEPGNAGAIILATAFPNATYMGLPVLESLFGPWGGGVAIQYDLFACTPLLFTLGIYLAVHFGAGDGKALARNQAIGELVKIPAIWAALVAVLCNGAGFDQPPLIHETLQLMARAVVPLMLIAIGLSLQWQRQNLHLLPAVVPVLLFRLILIPFAVWLLVRWLPLEPRLVSALVLEAGMPSMVIGLVLCDRFNLNINLYALAVTLTTGLSLITLPLWYSWLG